MLLQIIAILTTLALFAAAAGVYFIQFQKRRAADRLQRFIDEEHTTVLSPTIPTTSLPAAARAVTVLAWLFPSLIYSETLKWDLAQGGFRHPDARKVFAGLRAISTLVIGLAGAAASLMLRRMPIEMLFFTLAAGAVGYIAPMLWLRWLQAKRQEDIRLSLPDALDLLVICVEAGQGLNAALLKVGRESALQARPLSDELKTVNTEMITGVPRAQALRNFALRSGVDDVRALVAVMIQSDRFGTSIAQALRTHAASLRTRRRQRAEEAARKTPVKLVFPLVFCIFPELMVVILAPGMLQVYRALASMSQ